MSDRVDRPLRILVTAGLGTSAGVAPPAGARTFDYAGLAEQARHLREARAASRQRRAPAEPPASAVAPARARAEAPTGAPRGRPPARSPARSPIATTEAANSGPADALPDDDAAATADEATARRDAAERALGARVAEAAWPVVREVTRVADSMTSLIAILAREVAAFCADPSISQSGPWAARIPLDERFFAQTTLYLELSFFKLSLRFDTADAGTRQLLCDHTSSLERDLEKLMNAWSEPRDIEITVW
jgi:type III secretion control protein HpaP